ncbi:SET domain-containing protein-lysine N-methyltransferase [Pleionea sp. CnH1-48]|uniref:SET domain-containing protein-lysine N-methyltransferase n=1 Tax=Pleionea sp. CnH1-48 TaxID=2954494 RepID=UPI0020969A48|nr:SET domain-containing protein-lysine N-methyltransferase [Pleionea sp. CnH1-48]MCO7224414.1 hypothetical protein [Pleionea sp. CnH1-48]
MYQFIDGKLVATQDIRPGDSVEFSFLPAASNGPYVWFDKNLKNPIVLLDDLKHILHSEKPNLSIYGDGKVVADKDIKKGEEVTCDYGRYYQRN